MRQTFLAAAAALLLAPPAIATAADPLPVGQAQGVRLTAARGVAVFHFSKRAAALHGTIAGRRVEVSCTTLPRGDKLGPVSIGETGTSMRAPRRRAPLRVRIQARGADYCAVTLLAGQAEIVAVPLTRRGAILLDEREKATALSTILDFAGAYADRTRPSAYPTPERFLATSVVRDLNSGGVMIVALAAPADTPAEHTIGYWSDGARSVALVTRSATGRRLYLQLGPDGALSTNVAGALFGD